MRRLKHYLEGGHTPATFPEPSSKLKTEPISTIEANEELASSYKDLNKADLKAEAARRNLTVSGTKSEVIERLKEADEERSE